MKQTKPVEITVHNCRKLLSTKVKSLVRGGKKRWEIAQAHGLSESQLTHLINRRHKVQDRTLDRIKTILAAQSAGGGK